MKIITIIALGMAILVSAGVTLLFLCKSDATAVKEPKSICTFANLGPSSVRQVSFSPNGKMLACCVGPRVIVWDMINGVVIKDFFPHQGNTSALAFSPDGRFLATGGKDKTLRLWETTGWHESKVFQSRGWIVSIAFSLDGKFVASGNRSDLATIIIWNLASGEPVSETAHRSSIRALAFSPDGQILLSAGADSVVNVWTLPEIRLAKSFTRHRGKGTEGVNCLAFAKDGGVFVTGGVDGSVIVWDANGLKQKAVFGGHLGSVSGVSLSPNGKILASVSGNGNDLPGQIKLWDMVGMTEIANWSAHESLVNCVAFSPDGEMLATGSWFGSVKLWRVADLLNKER